MKVQKNKNPYAEYFTLRKGLRGQKIQDYYLKT
jgi:hypothetical protein